jgi:Zn-finger protein
MRKIATVKYNKFKKFTKGNECKLCHSQNHRQELRNLLMNVEQQKSDEVQGQLAPFLIDKQLFV